LKSPDFKRLDISDFNLNDPEWLNKFIGVLNLYMEQTSSVLNNLSIQDNIIGGIIPATFSTPSDYGTGGFTPILLPWNEGVNAQVIMIGYIRSVNTPQIPLTTAISLQWTQPSATNIKIDFIAGLSASTKYSARFLIF